MSISVEQIFNLIVQVLEISGPVGFAALFGLMAVESFGVPPLPSEVILPVAGFLIATGKNPYFTWPTVLLGALAGSLLGALSAHAVGERLGLPFVERFGAKFGLSRKDLARTQQYFERRGPITVCLARMVPIIRAYVSYPAGAAHMGRARFALYTFCGSVPFTAVLVYAGFVLGSNYGEVRGVFEDLEIVVGIALVLLLVYVVHRLRARRRASASTGAAPAAEGGPSGPPAG